jgi:glutathione S-transferase
MLDGNYMGDSQLIIEELERRRAAAGKEPLDAGMSVQDTATARLVRRTLEEALYFVGLYQRWVPDEGYRATSAEFAKFVPKLIIPLVRRMQRKKLYEQGTGRHTFDEVMAMGIADWDAISGTLGDKPFLLGDKPRIVDAGLYGFLEGTLSFPVDTPLRAHVRSKANLVAFRDRIRAQWWKDLPAA